MKSKFLFLTLSICIFILPLSAQLDRADYGATHGKIVGASITSTGTVYSFLGGTNIGDGNFFPDTLSLEGVNKFERQAGSPLGAETTIDTWWSPFNNEYYQLEVVDFNCDAGARGMQITSFSKDEPSQVSTVDITDLGVYFLSPLSLAVVGNLFVILDNDRLLISSFDSILDTTIVQLSTPLDDHFRSRMTTTRDKVHVADGTRLITIDGDAVVSELNVSDPIIGLGAHGFTNPGIFVVTTEGSYRYRDGEVIDEAPFAGNYSFESFVIDPHGRRYLCTYRENGGELRYGLNLGSPTMSEFAVVDPENPGRFTEFIETTALPGGGLRSVAALYFENSHSSILMSTQNASEFLDLEVADVDIVDVEMEVVPDDPPTSLYFAKPTIRNNSPNTIETVQITGEFFVANCLVRNEKTYSNLSIQPGEELQLERMDIYYPALEVSRGSLFGRVNLTSANNYPIKPGNTWSMRGEVIISDIPEAFAKTLAVWPNPVSEVLHIDASDLGAIHSALVSDVLGKTHALSLQQGQIDVAHLPKGHYTLVLTGQSGAAARSVFVKQ